MGDACQGPGGGGRCQQSPERGEGITWEFVQYPSGEPAVRNDYSI